jgi:hypothetical protein
MTRGEYQAYKMLQSKSREDQYTIQVLPYRSEELVRYLDQKNTMRNQLKEEKKIFDHLDQTVEKTVNEALDDLFKGWK